MRTSLLFASILALSPMEADAENKAAKPDKKPQISLDFLTPPKDTPELNHVDFALPAVFFYTKKLPGQRACYVKLNLRCAYETKNHELLEEKTMGIVDDLEQYLSNVSIEEFNKEERIHNLKTKMLERINKVIGPEKVYALYIHEIKIR